MLNLQLGQLPKQFVGDNNLDTSIFITVEMKY